MILVDIIGIGLEEQRNAVDQPADPKEAAGKEIHDAHTDFAFVKLVAAKHTKEEAEQECDPLVFGPECNNRAIDVGVFVGVGVCIVDDNVGLFSMLQLLHLAAAMRTDHCGCTDLLSTVLTELGVLLCGVGGNGILVHIISLLIRF